MNGITKEDLRDEDVVDAEELSSDGTTVYVDDATVVSTTTATKRIVLTGVDLIHDVDEHTEVADKVTLTGTTGADGTYTVADIIDEVTIEVEESIADSTGGTADFKHPSGASKVGFDPTNLTQTTATNVQNALEDIALIDHSRVIYVGKHGNDANDGKAPNRAKLTLAAAITAANALTPVSNNWVEIRGVGSGSYAETGLTPVGYIYFNLRDFRFQNNTTWMTIPTVGDLVLRVGLLHADDTILASSAGGGDIHLYADEIQAEAENPLLAITGGIKNFHLHVNELSLEEGKFCETSNTATPKVYLELGRASLEESDCILFDVTGSSGGEYSVTLGMAPSGDGTLFQSSSGTTPKFVGYLGYVDANYVWNIAGGSLKVFVCSLSGTQSVTSPATAEYTLPGHYWTRDASGFIKPAIDGDDIRVYHSDGVQYANLNRSGGNFAISVGGTDAQALYKNCKKEVTQLGGTDQSVFAHVGNGGDAPCHTIYGDKTTKLYGLQRHTNDGSSTEYMDVGRDGTQGYMTVYGGTRILQLTQKILEARLAGSSTAEMLRIISDAGDVFKVFANQTAQFYGDVTHQGDVLPDGNNTRDLGASSARWNTGYFQTAVRLSAGSSDNTEYANGSITNQNAEFTVEGGFGLTFKVSQVLNDSVFKFVGKDATHSGQLRAYYGVGTGTAWTEITHDGTDGSITSNEGDLHLKASDHCVVMPTASADPTTPVDAGVWHNSTSDKFRGQLNSVKLNFSMEFPPAATNPTSGMVDGSRYYNTTLKMWMTYDGSRSKWLSEETVTIQVGRNGDTLAGAYYRGVNGLLLSDTLGYDAFYNGTIVGLSYTRTDTDACTHEVTADGTAIAELASSAAAGRSVTLDGDFNQGDILAVRNKTGGNTTSSVQIWVKIKWRAPERASLISNG